MAFYAFSAPTSFFLAFRLLFGSTAVLGSFAMLDSKGLQVYVLYNMHM